MTTRKPEQQPPPTEKRVANVAGAGWRRHGDPPAWLDESLPLELRRKLLDRSIRAAASASAKAAESPEPDAPDAPRGKRSSD